VLLDPHVATVSLVGGRMTGTPGVAARMFEALADRSINVDMITSSPIRLSCAIPEKAVDEAVRGVHAAFALGDQTGRRNSHEGHELARSTR
jgi:aspartate kinase